MTVLISIFGPAGILPEISQFKLGTLPDVFSSWSFDAALRAENVNDPSRMGCNNIPISGTREETALLSFNVY